jgi:hypothetical protein
MVIHIGGREFIVAKTLVVDQTQKWAKVIRAANIKVE